MQALLIDYRAQDGAVTERVIEPHYLLLSYPVWYVLSWDYLRQDSRLFRCDRIFNCKACEDSFKLLPLDRFEKALEGVPVI